ncbi:MAG: zinc ribbon domain-containing protein [Syntrophales bacterium]|nr:zinc ribbon domain-containing protein [Syntrophales bacterium]
MPIYEYECDQGGHRYEIIQKTGESKPKKCKYCSGELKRVISTPTLLKNAGIYLYDRKMGKDIIHDK